MRKAKAAKTWNKTEDVTPDTARDVVIWDEGDNGIRTGFFRVTDNQWFEFERQQIDFKTKIQPPAFWMDILKPTGKPFS